MALLVMWERSFEMAVTFERTNIVYREKIHPQDISILT